MAERTGGALGFTASGGTLTDSAIYKRYKKRYIDDRDALDFYFDGQLHPGFASADHETIPRGDREFFSGENFVPGGSLYNRTLQGAWEKVYAPLADLVDMYTTSIATDVLTNTAPTGSMSKLAASIDALTEGFIGGVTPDWLDSDYKHLLEYNLKRSSTDASITAADKIDA